MPSQAGITEAEGAREGVESDLGGASCYYTFHPLPRTGAAEGERSFAGAQDDKEWDALDDKEWDAQDDRGTFRMTKGEPGWAGLRVSQW